MLQKKVIKEEEIHLRDYVRIMLRRMWIVIISLVISATTVTIFSSKAIPIYQTTTQVITDRESMNVVSFEDVNPNYSESCVFMACKEQVLSNSIQDIKSRWDHISLRDEN